MAIESSVSSTIEERSNDGLSGTDWAYILYPRICGLITMMSSLCMMIMAWQRRKFLFHRLVLAMSIHQLIYGFVLMLGTLPIPRELEGYVHNYGTWTTCTVQGLFLFFCIRCALVYYACFSIYSYVGVLSCFDKQRYQWVEKIIHIIAHIYPSIMAIYYLFMQGFNPDHGFCANASYPLACETSEVVCERGPDDLQWYHNFLLWLLPMLVFLGVPTIVMVVLYYKIKKREASLESGKTFYLQSKSIAIQSCAYLSTLYWTAIPFFILGVLRYYMRSNSDALFPIFLASQINFSLFALWSLLVYRHFSIEAPTNRRRGKNKELQPRSTAFANSLSLHVEEDNLPQQQQLQQHDHHQTTRTATTVEFIFKFGNRSSSCETENATDSPTTKTEVAKQRNDGHTEGQQTIPPTPTPKVVDQLYSLNIFDGTNSSGYYAKFIYEGDSDDEREDRKASEHWATVQEHV